jgi:hypothetical protein
MKTKSLASCSPILLCLVAGAARADLEPFSFDVSETLQHQSNILHAEADHKADWMSTTEFRAALDQAIGRQRVKANASVNVDRYADLSGRNSEGYAAGGEFDWSTVGDLSGANRRRSRRRQYLYGVDGDQSSGLRNLQTDNHAFAHVQLGGQARWSIFAGFDASQRKYSDSAFDSNEVEQWATSGGTSYQTSPDLSFGVQGRYVRGRYPNVVLSTGKEEFSVKTLGVNTKWTASGNSSFDANVGYTHQKTDGQDAQNYINGGVNWHWAPPSHFVVTLGLTRDSNTDSGTAASIVNTNNSVSGRSLNTIAHLDVDYALTAKVGIDLLTQYIHRKYSDALVATGVDESGVTQYDSVTGATNTSRVTLSAHYAPTRTTALSCGFSREIHSSGQAVHGLSAPYTDNTVLCSASIHFD